MIDFSEFVAMFATLVAAPPMSDEDLADLKAAFAEADTDKSGTISVKGTG
jgi:hypothetical protein